VANLRRKVQLDPDVTQSPFKKRKFDASPPEVRTSNCFSILNSDDMDQDDDEIEPQDNMETSIENKTAGKKVANTDNDQQDAIASLLAMAQTAEQLKPQAKAPEPIITTVAEIHRQALACESQMDSQDHSMVPPLGANDLTCEQLEKQSTETATMTDRTDMMTRTDTDKQDVASDSQSVSTVRTGRSWEITR